MLCFLLFNLIELRRSDFRERNFCNFGRNKIGHITHIQVAETAAMKCRAKTTGRKLIFDKNGSGFLV